MATAQESTVNQQGCEIGEVPFPFEELFFSRTDSRGIILAGNSVFQRISQYEWDELIKKPHNVIRHPDMPKGVFYLLWDFLKKNKPIGAYVKNRTKDGRYYWVFAVATPVEGGYLSVRLKPSSEFFPIIKDAYKALLVAEREEKLTPKASMEKIVEMLKGLGFGSYEEFMSAAIRKEMTSRSQQLRRRPEKFLQSFEALAEQAGDIMSETASIFKSYEANRYVPMNLQIQSAQLGDEGRSIGVISANFSIVSTEIQEEIGRFNQSAMDVFNKIQEGQFLLCVAEIQSEVLDFFKREAEGTGDGGQANEMELLNRQKMDYQKKAVTGLRSIMHNIERFQEDCRQMKKCAASLEVIRVMGKVDVASKTVKGSLQELINDLKEFQTIIAEGLTRIERHSLSMRFDTEGVISSLKIAS